MRSIAIIRDVLLLILALGLFMFGPLDINPGANTPDYTDLERHSGTVLAYDCQRRAGRGEDILRLWLDGYADNPLTRHIGNDCSWYPQLIPSPVGKPAAVWVYPPQGARWIWQLVIDDHILVDFSSARKQSVRGAWAADIFLIMISAWLVYVVYTRKRGLWSLIQSRMLQDR